MLCCVPARRFPHKRQVRPKAKIFQVAYRYESSGNTTLFTVSVGRYAPQRAPNRLRDGTRIVMNQVQQIHPWAAPCEPIIDCSQGLEVSTSESVGKMPCVLLSGTIRNRMSEERMSPTNSFSPSFPNLDPYFHLITLVT